MYSRNYNMFYLIVAFQLLNPIGIFAQAEPNLNDILCKSREHLNRISSITYASYIETIETIKTQEENGNKSITERINQIFMYDKGKFRTVLTSPDPNGSQAWREVAFNGHIYQELFLEKASLNITRKRPLLPYSVMEIITTSYLFAIQPDPNSEISLETLREDKTWKKVKTVARYQSQKEIMEHPCVVMKLPYPAPQGATQRELVNLVAFAKDLSWFPVQFDSEVDGILASRWELNKYVVTDVGGSKFVMPLCLKGTAFTPDGEIWQKTTFVVEPESVEINSPISEETFTIDFSLAETVLDNDAQLYLKQRK